MASCRTWEAGSRIEPVPTHRRAARVLRILPTTTSATSLQPQLSDSGRSFLSRPLLSLPQEGALESHCGKKKKKITKKNFTAARLCSHLLVTGCWPSETLTIPGALCWTESAAGSRRRIWKLKILVTKQKKLRGMNSGLYFRNQLTFVLFFNTKKEKNLILLWWQTQESGEKKVLSFVLLLCRQFLLVERTVILFSYWMKKCLVWMLFIYGEIFCTWHNFQNTFHMICFKVDTQASGR